MSEPPMTKIFVPSVTADANSTPTAKGAIVVQVVPSNLYDVAGIALLLTPEKMYMLPPTVTAGSSRIGAGTTGPAVHIQAPGLGVGLGDGVPGVGVGLGTPGETQTSSKFQ